MKALNPPACESDFHARLSVTIAGGEKKRFAKFSSIALYLGPQIAGNRKRPRPTRPQCVHPHHCGPAR
jgi:hypothetical protein